MPGRKRQFEVDDYGRHVQLFGGGIHRRGAGGLSLWVEYLGLDDARVGLLGALSANGFGAAIGAFSAVFSRPLREKIHI